MVLSCGCYHREIFRKQITKHGLYHTPEYRVWAAMVQRCGNPKDAAYRHYGGRGITVCGRWKTFENFMTDMGCRPGPKMSLDGVDSNGNYEPGNVRWATQKEQMRNTRVNHKITFKGETLTIAEWADRLCLPYNTLSERVRRGFSLEDAMSKDRLLAIDQSTRRFVSRRVSRG